MNSSSHCCRYLRQVKRIHRSIDGNLYLLQRSRSKSSSAFADLPIPSVVRERAKTSLLNEAARDDSRLWRNKELGERVHINGYHHHHHHRDDESGGSGSVNDAISSVMQEDPLDDLYTPEIGVRYWPSLPPGVVATAESDPFELSRLELDRLTSSIREDLIGTDHPVLNKAASYFFDAAAGSGKKVRPMMVLLLSRALADSVSNNNNSGPSPVSSRTRVDDDDATEYSLFTAPLPGQRPDLGAAQRRLAEISEMIHTASLFHDDVIDEADTRRGVPAVHTLYGNKMAILAGDYLLARASICLARLRNVAVVETMSTIIEHLVRGEVMQLRGSTAHERGRERLMYYLRKNFYKTASLMANSCKSTALLGDYDPELVEASYRFGKHVGMAFQLVDDVLDYEGSSSQLGKPALSDLKAGLATAPVLFAAEEYGTQLEPLIERKFKGEGDVDMAVELVFASRGCEKTKELARVHAELAMDAVLELNPSRHRDALAHLANKVVARTK